MNNNNEKIIKALKGTTVSIGNLTRRVNSRVNLDRDPFGPFRGIDGKTYAVRQCSIGINCYAFAMGWNCQVRKESGVYTPGFLNGMVRYDDPIIESVKSDLTWLGREVIEVFHEIPETLPKAEKGTYYIKYLKAKGTEGIEGIHFMVKDPKSGRWIHKMGWEARPKVVLEYKFESTREHLKRELRAKNPLLSDSILDEILAYAMVINPHTEAYIPVEMDYPEKDSGGYVSYDGKVLVEYEPIFVMRIS